MSFEADENEIREAVKRGDVEWVLSAFRYKGTEQPKCTCDANCDSPCPAHERENKIQDELVQARNENTTLRALVSSRQCPYGHNKEGKGCELGYPGCACADDLLVFDMERSSKAGEELERLRKKLHNAHNILHAPGCTCGFETEP